MTVKKENHGTVHRQAVCNACNWNDAYSGRDDSIERVQRAAKSHTSKTGHSVTVESGSSFTYFKEY